jgi:hypothetical protein
VLRKTNETSLPTKSANIYDYCKNFISSISNVADKELVWDIFDKFNVAYDDNVPTVIIDEVNGTYIVTVSDDISVKHIEWHIDGVHAPLFDNQTTVAKSDIESLFNSAFTLHEIVISAYDPTGYKAMLNPTKPVEDILAIERQDNIYGYLVIWIN